MYAGHPICVSFENCTESPSCIDQIDKQTLEIAQAGDETFSNMQELADELPGHSPRFILLSYPLTLVERALVFTACINIDWLVGIRSAFSTLCAALLPASNLQC